MEIQCYGIYCAEEGVNSIGIILTTSNRNTPYHHTISAGTPGDDEATKKRIAQCEAVLWGLRKAQKTYTEFLNTPPLTRMSFVDLGGNERHNPLDLRGIKKISFFADKTTELLWCNNPPAQSYSKTIRKNWHQFQELRSFFNGCDIEIVHSQGLFSQAKELAEMYRPDSQIRSYTKEVNDLIKSGEIVVPISIFKNKPGLTLAEVLVLELIDRAGLPIPAVARILVRDYNTIQTQYYRAKKKLSVLGIS